MFAYVDDKSRRGKSFLDVKVDISKSAFLKESGNEQGYVKVFCYLIDSFATSLREYRTLRMSEFYGLTQTILRPDVSLQKLKANGERHPNWQRMESFVKNFGSRFNKSQGEAL